MSLSHRIWYQHTDNRSCH